MLGEKFTNGTVLFLNCYFSFYERSIEMVFEMFGEKSKQYYTTLHYTTLYLTTLHCTTLYGPALHLTALLVVHTIDVAGLGEAKPATGTRCPRLALHWIGED